MLIEYISISLAFGFATYFGLYGAARDKAFANLNKKASKTSKAATFTFWVLISSALMPLLLPGYLFRYKSTRKSIQDKLEKGFGVK